MASLNHDIEFPIKVFDNLHLIRVKFSLEQRDVGGIALCFIAMILKHIKRRKLYERRIFIINPTIRFKNLHHYPSLR